MKLTKQEKAKLALMIKELDRAEQSKRDSFLAVTKNGVKFHMEQLWSDDSRRDFLTEIFGLTEELRDEISLPIRDKAETERHENRTVALRNHILAEREKTCGGTQEREANTNDEQIITAGN